MPKSQRFNEIKFCLGLLLETSETNALSRLTLLLVFEVRDASVHR